MYLVTGAISQIEVVDHKAVDVRNTEPLEAVHGKSWVLNRKSIISVQLHHFEYHKADLS